MNHYRWTVASSVNLFQNEESLKYSVLLFFLSLKEKHHGRASIHDGLYKFCKIRSTKGEIL